ncbi:cbb3-type cytochrome c oxidase subunit I [Acidipila rosea]|uniref:Cytochrome c oxidase cbb3-type subunit I/II n=1 Tax=Acidipila rosea TaxID=768535 RepID=A0A4R1L7Y4_9BACT|nr:cbb3-type cytochrome c oxidase subunit I [Acidipila rosea]TCK74344.1 cytochrome c oxidase cbb3-type subunit I/II [Acidipila rosea]
MIATEVQARVPVASKLVRAHTYAAFVGLLLSALFGLAVSVKFHVPEFLTNHAALTWGRLRYDHTQGILYAWLGNAFIAFIYFAVPYLTRRPVTSERLGWVMFFVYNFVAVLGGWSLVLAGVLQPLEWAEFPLIVAAVIELCLALMIVQFCIPFLKCGASELYVSGWYLLGGLTFTFLAYPLGNIVPHELPGAMGAAFSGLWIHDAVGVFITPLAVAVEYFVITAVTRKPIYSHFYSMVGFWLLFLVYPLNGIHHYIYSSLPMAAQRVSEAASIYQGIDVILVVTNLLLSIGLATEGSVLRDVPMRFVWTSIVLYLIVSIQGSVQAVMTFNSFIHFTDWVIGHSHLAMIGFASFAAMGGLGHIWQQMPGVRHSRRAMAWSYWLLVIGLGLMVLDLTAAGLVQATLWQRHIPWIDSVRASRPYWIFRTIDGVVLLAGFVVFGLSFVTGPRNSEGFLGLTLDTKDELPRDHKAQYWFTTAYAATFGAGVVFFFLSFLALGVYPAFRLRESIHKTTPVGAQLTLTAAEQHGGHLYAVDGCAYCHSMQVRFTPADVWRFGTPTQAWETQQQYPQMWGTRRIGPDLAREAGKRPVDWQLVHLYDPRYIVPDSVMPSYPWLFNGAPDRPTQDARDLVAFLNTLGRAQAALTPPLPRATYLLPVAASANDTEEGRQVFVANCAGCHGEKADGRSIGGQSLRPVAFNLAEFKLSDDLIWRVLQTGVPGSSMPSWNDLPSSDFRAVADYVAMVAQAGELTPDQRYASDEVLMESGRRIFETHCTRCHGEEAAGDGPDGLEMLPRPANFHEMMPSYQAAAEILRDGVPGSGMPAWPLLTPAEVQAVTFYIRSFYSAHPDGTAQPAASASMKMEGMK